jgi:hypothetical protein
MLEQSVNSNKQTLSKYYKLEAMDLGLKELKILRNTYLEIAYANNISIEGAGKKFFKDIEEQYDSKLGFESKRNKLANEVNILNQQKLKSIAEINEIAKLGTIIKLLSIEGNNSVEEFESLVDQVRKAGGIRATIKKLEVPLSTNDSYKSSSTKDIQKKEEVDPLTDDDSSGIIDLGELNKIVEQLKSR